MKLENSSNGSAPGLHYFKWESVMDGGYGDMYPTDHFLKVESESTFIIVPYVPSSTAIDGPLFRTQMPHLFVHQCPTPSGLHALLHITNGTDTAEVTDALER